MIGIIVTGHGTFATGITSGVKLLAGEPVQYEVVDFTQEDSILTLEEKLREAMVRLKECSGLLVLADLTGGSPFNVSCHLKEETESISMEVIGGINLPAVLQAYMARISQEDAALLAKDVLACGQGAMVRFQTSVLEDDDYEEE